MLDLREMLKAGIHFGHRTSRWFPKMQPYIWGAKNKIHLIDVSKTAFLLEKTGKFVKDVTAQGGTILWVGTKKPAQAIVKTIAATLNNPYVVHRWVGGTLSNFEQVKKAITRLLHLRDVLAKPVIQYTKKELVTIQKEVERLEKNIGGIIELHYPPAAIIVVDAKHEQSAVKEASRLGIPVIAMVDTNTDPSGVNFVIPANDDSPKSIQFVLDYLHKQVEAGSAEYKANEGERKKNDGDKEAIMAKLDGEAAPRRHSTERRAPVRAPKSAAAPQISASQSVVEEPITKKDGE